MDFIFDNLRRKSIILSYHFLDFLLYGVDNVPSGLCEVVEEKGRIGCRDAKEAASKKLRDSDIKMRLTQPSKARPFHEYRSFGRWGDWLCWNNDGCNYEMKGRTYCYGTIYSRRVNFWI